MNTTILTINLIISIAIILITIMAFHLNAVISLVLASLYMGVASGLGWMDTISTIGSGFGNTMASMGISIILGVIIGELLSQSGGANVIAETMVRVFPEKKALYAIALTSFILSIPVFFDITFIILIPIGISIAKKINKSIAYVVGAIAIGGCTAHVLVPPTPNPLAAPEIFGFDLGFMLIGGLIIGLLNVLIVLPLYTTIMDRGFFKESDLDPDAEIEISANKATNCPSFFASLLPIIIPLVCILCGTVGNALWEEPPMILKILGNRLPAMLLGTLAAYLISYKSLGKKGLDEAGNAALKGSGIAAMVTAAGGAFGAVIQATDIGNKIVEGMGIEGTSGGIILMLVGFGIAFIFKIAQGSGTVAGITSMQIMAGFAGGLSIHPFFLAVACLSGGMGPGHLNDSAFWVTTNLSGMKVSGGLKTYTMSQMICAFVIFAIALIGALFLPISATLGVG